MFEKFAVKACNVVVKVLASVADMATNSVSLYGQYEHEMPKSLCKKDVAFHVS